MGFLPAGWPYNQMQGGAGNQLAAPTNPYLQGANWYSDFLNTPMGQQQAAQEEQARAYLQQQASQEYGLKVRQLDMQAKQIALTEGNQAAQQWLNREHLKLAQQAQADQRLQNDRSYQLNMLQQQANLRGPKTAQQYIDMMAGHQSLQPHSGFMSQMLQGQYSPTQGATTGHATLSDLAPEGNNLAAMQQRQQNDVGLAQQIAARPEDYQKAYRHANQYQKDYLGGTIEYAGGDEGTFLEKMRRGSFANNARA